MRPRDETVIGQLWDIVPQGGAVTSNPLSASDLRSMRPARAFYGGTEAMLGNPDRNLFAPMIYWTNKLPDEAQERQQQLNQTAYTLFRCVEAIASKLDGLVMELAELRKIRTFVVPLTALASEGVQMKLSIPATIEGSGEDFTATFSEANVSASGETEADAIANLKDSLVATFEFLESLPEKDLGPLPARQWGVLKNVFTR